MEQLKTQPIRILLTGGGSGGHVYPLLATGRAVQKAGAVKGIKVELYYLGPKDAFSQILSSAGVAVKFLAAAKLRRYFSILNLLDIPKFFIGLFQAFFKVFFVMPDIVFSKGGPGALPTVLAARFYRIPVVIHESDAIPGLTNAISARFATRIAVSFPSAQTYFPPAKVFVSGHPLRDDLGGDQLESKAAKAALEFEPEKPLLLILGGSQGAEPINNLIFTNLGPLLRITQIFHQAGTANYKMAEEMSRAGLLELSPKESVHLLYRIVPYITDGMKNALAAADLIVSRAGSNAIFEIAAFGKPAILIPLQRSANGHQRENAYEFAKTGAAVTIEENNMLSGIFDGKVKEILEHEALRNKMAEAAAQFFAPNAADTIAQELLGAIGK